MTGQRADLGPLVGLPDLDCSAGIGDRDFQIVRVNGDGRDRGGLLGIGFDEHPVVHVEQAGDLVLTPGQQPRAVELKTDGGDCGGVPVEIAQRLLVGVVPQPTRLVIGTGGHHRVVRTDSQRPDHVTVSDRDLLRRARVRPALDETFGSRRHDPRIVGGIAEARDFHGMSTEHALRSAVDRVEESHEARRIGRRDLSLVRSKGNLHDRVRQAGDLLHQSSIRRIPDAQHLVRASSQPLRPIGVQREDRRASLMRLVSDHRFRDRHVPQSDRIVERPADEAAAVLRQRRTQDQPGMTAHRAQRRRRVEIPQPQRLVKTGRHQLRSVRRVDRRISRVGVSGENLRLDGQSPRDGHSPTECAARCESQHLHHRLP